MARVTVLLATFNSERYVGELIASILNQTFSDFELVVRDDGSSDGTRKLVSSFKDKRITLLEDHEPSGSAENNFFRLLLSRDGDYFMFADADDIWLPEKIEKTYNRMAAEEAALGEKTPVLVHSDLTVVAEDLSVISPSLFKYEKLSVGRNSLKCLVAQNNVTGCTMMINRALRSLVNERPESAVMHDWWLALIAAAFGKIAVIDEPLILYRQHGDNQVGAYNAGDLAASAKKLSRTDKIKAVYLSMFNQAECFAETFKDSLSPEQYEVCAEYARLRDKNKLSKIASIIKHGYFKNTFIRNIGQFIAI